MGEMISGEVVALGVAVVLSIKWIVHAYTTSKIKDTTENLEVKGLLERVSNLEKDLKANAIANLELSQALHAEINKILHKLPGDTNG